MIDGPIDTMTILTKVSDEWTRLSDYFMSMAVITPSTYSLETSLINISSKGERSAPSSLSFRTLIAQIPSLNPRGRLSEFDLTGNEFYILSLPFDFMFVCSQLRIQFWGLFSWISLFFIVWFLLKFDVSFVDRLLFLITMRICFFFLLLLR